MRNSVKFAVSMSEEEFKAMEASRKKAKLTRSAFIRDSVQAWHDALRHEAERRAYLDGYRRHPEDPALVETLAAAGAESLTEEDWS